MGARMTIRPTARPESAVASRPRGAAVCLALALLSGCVLGPDYQRPPVDIPETWRAEPTAPAEIANTEWWRTLGDPDLDRLIGLALEANKDLQLAVWRIAEYDARLQISRSALAPQIGYTALAERQRFSQERPTGGGGLQSGVGPIINNFAIGGLLSWEVDLWGKVQRANEAALAELLSKEDARRGVMLTVVTDVAANYVQLLELDQALWFARQALAKRIEAFELAQAKYRGGSTTKLFVEQTRAAVEVARSDVPLIERDIAVVESALSALLGRNPGPIKRRKIDLLKIPELPDGVPADVLSRRPDVLAAEQNLIAANARIGVAKTQYFPTLSLAAALGLASDNVRWLFAETARTGLLGAGLTGPIFSGGRIEGDIRQAEAIQKQMTVRYEQAVQTAVREVDDALVTRAKAGEREAAIDQQVAAHQEVSQLARVRYEGGQANYMEVIDADLAVFASQGRQAQGRRDTLLAAISVFKAMGGGWMVEYDKSRMPAMPSADAAQALLASEPKAQQ